MDMVGEIYPNETMREWRLIEIGMALTFQSAEAVVQMMMGNEEEVEKWLPKCYRVERIPET